MSNFILETKKLKIEIAAAKFGMLSIRAAQAGIDVSSYLCEQVVSKSRVNTPLPCPGVASERVGEPTLVREVLPEVVGGELAPVMELVDDLELGLREPEEEGREYGAE